jgi:ribosomal protein S18 acetylase RimI-like enzyme
MSTPTMSGFSIRRCTVDDAAATATLGARLFTETYGPTHPEPELSRYLARSFSLEAVRGAISDSDVSMLLVEDSLGNPVAYAYMRASPDSPAGVVGERPFEIVRFYVDGAYQGQGVGAALMDACLADARERRADVVWLQVWKEAPWAVGFYRRMGFSVVGSAPFYFGEQVGDDHIMLRSL